MDLQAILATIVGGALLVVIGYGIWTHEFARSRAVVRAVRPLSRPGAS